VVSGSTLCITCTFVALACNRPSAPVEARPSSSAVASASAAPTVGAPDPFPIEELPEWFDVPKLVAEATPPARKTTAAACRNKTLHALPLPELEALAAKQDACAMNALASALIKSRPLPADYRRALGLANAAHDAGAQVGCTLLELGRDEARLPACYERSGDKRRLALKQPEKARALLAKEGDDCAMIALRELVEKGGTRDRHFCEAAACTTLDSNECGVERIARYDYLSSVRRERALNRLEVTLGAHYASLVSTLLAYADAESSRAYLDVVCGTIRNLEALGTDLWARQVFDTLLERAAAKTLAPITQAELERRGKRMAELEAELARRGIGQCSPDSVEAHQADFRKALADSSATYRRYEDAFAKLGATPDEQRRIRGTLRWFRIANIEPSPED
jgi:hypothetical protein